MGESVYLRALCRWIGAVGLSLSAAAIAVPSVAAELLITQRSIQSLASAPAIVSVEGGVSAAGSPYLTARLRFDNACLAAGGAKALAGQTSLGPPHVLILAPSRRLGCPADIDPIERVVAIALPEIEATPGARVIGRPGMRGLARRLGSMTPSFDASEEAGVEAFALAFGDQLLPSFAFVRVAPDPYSDGGYRIEGSLSLAEECSAGDIEIRLFEVPDDKAAPRFDVIILSAPSICTSGDVPTELSITVASPHPRPGRAIYVLNELEPLTRPLP
ncbi:MAG: hypothetical protein AAF713_11105 [Pseudomonadota bacterium]